MEQLIIFLLFVVASIVSSIIQKKKRDEEAAQLERELRAPPSSQPAPAPARPVARWPRSAQEWQEQLRKMVEENAPPVIKPIIVPEKPEPKPPVRPIAAKILPPLEKSEGDLEFRSPFLEPVAHEGPRTTGQPAMRRSIPPRRAAPRAAHAVVRRLRGRPHALREAFIASLVFAPPKSLEVAQPQSFP